MYQTFCRIYRESKSTQNLNSKCEFWSNRAPSNLKFVFATQSVLYHLFCPFYTSNQPQPADGHSKAYPGVALRSGKHFQLLTLEGRVQLLSCLPLPRGCRLANSWTHYGWFELRGYWYQFPLTAAYSWG